MDNHKETHLKVIKYARDLLADENGWTQHTFARNSNREAVSVYDENACSFCLAGAIQRAVYKISGSMDNSSRPEFHYCEIINNIYDDVLDVVNYGITSWNDNESTSSEDVLKLMDNIIERLEKDERV